jgi:hypothetical protein
MFENKFKKGIRLCEEDFICAAVTGRLISVRCQEVDIGGYNRLRMLI